MIGVFAKRVRNQKAFTLVELLVVVAIIAILAAVLLPQLMGYTTKARTSRAMSDLATMRSIVEAYCADEGKGSYPAPDNASSNASGIAAVLGAHGVKWGGETGIKDPWGSPYYYHAPLSGNNYLEFILVSPGPDKDVGNEDDIYCTNAQAPVTGDPTLADPALGDPKVASAQ
ncbi:MAG: type II secretion system protein [Bacillota bacterium]